MHRGSIGSWLGVVGTAGLGWLLLLTVASKLLDPFATVATLRFVLIDTANGSDQLVRLAFALLLGLESLLGIGAVLRPGSLNPRIALLALFSLFAGFVLFLWLSSAPVGCGCGFDRDDSVSAADVTRAIAFAIVCVAITIEGARASNATPKPTASAGAALPP